MTFNSTEYLGGEGYALIGAAFEVHRELGGGMSEEIYQESFELELGFRSIKFIPKGELQLYLLPLKLRLCKIADLRS